MSITVIPVSKEETLTAAVFGDVVRCSGSANYALTLPTAVEAANETLLVQMSPALAAVVTLLGHEGQTIGGAASRQMLAGEDVTLVSDGSNWLVLYAYVKPCTACIRVAAKQSLSATTVEQLEFNQVDADSTGSIMTNESVAKHGILIPRTGNYRVTISVQTFTTVAKTLVGVLFSVNEGEAGAYLLGVRGGGGGSSTTITWATTKVCALTAGIVLYGFAGGGANEAFGIMGSATEPSSFMDVEEIVK